MATPETSQLIEDAKQLRQGIVLFEAAQRATLVYLCDLIDATRKEGDTDAVVMASEAQATVQHDIEMAQMVLPEVESLIAGETQDQEFVQIMLPKITSIAVENIIDLIETPMCIEMLRESCRQGATITKERAEKLLELGLDKIFPAQFEEKARQSIEQAREVIAFLSP